MALRGHKNECGKCQPGFYLEFQRNLFWKMRSQILVLYSNLWPVSLRKMGERSNKIHGLLLFQPLFLQLSTKTIHMTSRQPCYCSQTIKFPTLGKWFLFFLKSFFFIQVWIHLLEAIIFNVFSISARLPNLPLPDLVFVTVWMNILHK